MMFAALMSSKSRSCGGRYLDEVVTAVAARTDRDVKREDRRPT